ncbi:MAG: hypothetical protein IT426_11665 [Pirellulales bacterium]|nr:hypothetical protein [Pirellulales bacterium]
MATNKNLEAVWHWKDEVAKDTESLTAEEQLEYFHRVSRGFLDKADPPFVLPVYRDVPLHSSQG